MQQAKDYASADYQQYIVGWQQCTAHTVQSEKQTKMGATLNNHEQLCYTAALAIIG